MQFMVYGNKMHKVAYAAKSFTPFVISLMIPSFFTGSSTSGFEFSTFFGSIAATPGRPSGLSGFGVRRYCAGINRAAGLRVNPNPGLSSWETLRKPLTGIGSSKNKSPKTGRTLFPSGELARYSWNGQLVCETTSGSCKDRWHVGQLGCHMPMPLLPP